MLNFDSHFITRYSCFSGQPIHQQLIKKIPVVVIGIMAGSRDDAAGGSRGGRPGPGHRGYLVCSVVFPVSDEEGAGKRDSFIILNSCINSVHDACDFFLGITLQGTAGIFCRIGPDGHALDNSIDKTFVGIKPEDARCKPQQPAVYTGVLESQGCIL